MLLWAAGAQWELGISYNELDLCEGGHSAPCGGEKELLDSGMMMGRFFGIWVL
jgi:hypothetical protein